MGDIAGSAAGLTPVEDYEKYKLPFVKTEYGLLIEGHILNAGEDRKYAEELWGGINGELVFRSVSDWLPIKDKG